MYQPIVLCIGLRYMCGRVSNRFASFISWLSIIGIALGIMAMVTVLSVMNGFEHELEINILELMPQALLTTPEGRFDPKHISISVPRALTGITCVAPFITSDVVLQSARSITMGVMLGVNQEDPEPLSHYLLETKKNDLVSGQYQVILGAKLAAALNVKRGDAVRIIVPNINQFTPVGRIPIQRIFTVAGTFATNSEVDSYQLLVNQQDAAHIMCYPSGYITGWRLWLQKPLAVENLKLQSLPDNLVWHDWRERKGELFQAVRMEKNMMGLLLSLIIIVATFNIITSLGLLATEKQTEIAILQTQGLTCRQVMLIFIVHGASAGIIGALFGAGFGVLLTSQLNHLISVLRMLLEGDMLPVVIEPIQVAVITLSAIVAALLSAIYPSWRAATIHPAKALRYE